MAKKVPTMEIKNTLKAKSHSTIVFFSLYLL